MADDGVQDCGPARGPESTLLERVRVRETQAWQTFVRLYAPLVYHWCRRAGLQGSDAAYVGREAFQRVLDGIAGFHPDGPGSFRNWVRAVTRDRVRDFLGNRTNALGATGADAGPPASAPADIGPDEPDPDEESILYRRALALVLEDSREETRTAFVRVFFDGQDPAVVAADLGVTFDAVCLVRSRVLHRLRGLFTDLFEPCPE